MKSVGLSNYKQLKYLQAHRDLHPETKKIMYGRDEGKRPQVNKAFLEPIMSAAKTHSSNIRNG